MLRFAGRMAVLMAALVMPAASMAAEKTVGVVMTGGITFYKEIHKAFMEGLAAEGFGPGKADVILQTPNPEPMAWANAARKLVAAGSDVIVAYGAPATLAVLKETSELPVVFAGTYDPQGLGIPGRNASGISAKVPVASLLKSLKTVTGFTKLGIVLNDDEKDTVLQANEVKQLEGTFAFQTIRFPVKRPGDVAKIANVDVLFLTTSCSAMHCVDNIVGIAHKAKIPTATVIAGGEDRGVVFTLSADPAEQGREAAKMAVKVLKGAKPAGLPVESPKKIGLVINLKEATEMGLKVPLDILTTATRVIK